MGYFSKENIQAIASNASDIKQVAEQLSALHTSLFEQIQLKNTDLHILNTDAGIVRRQTVSHVNEDKLLTVQYTRLGANAVHVERLMGREEVTTADKTRIELHPVIELRLSEAGLALEFIISPDAWWDQQNLKGKLSVQRHRHEFYSMLMELQAEYCMGFWTGIHLSDMHLTGKYFQHPRILDEWLGTFHPNADWFRLGIWYDIDDERLSQDSIVDELFKQIQTLYPLYRYFLWTSDNNFRDFFTGGS